jgi:hypothetical protein
MCPSLINDSSMQHIHHPNMGHMLKTTPTEAREQKRIQ